METAETTILVGALEICLPDSTEKTKADALLRKMEAHMEFRLKAISREFTERWPGVTVAIALTRER